MPKEEPLTTKNFKGVFLDAFEPFTREIAKEFTQTHKRFNLIDKKLEKIDREILNLRFEVTELVRKEEFTALLKRVEKLEARLQGQ